MAHKKGEYDFSEKTFIERGRVAWGLHGFVGQKQAVIHFILWCALMSVLLNTTIKFINK